MSKIVVDQITPNDYGIVEDGVYDYIDKEFEDLKIIINNEQVPLIQTQGGFWYVGSQDGPSIRFHFQTSGGSGGMLRKKYNGHSYVVRTGARGGKYIVVKGKKMYV